MLAGTEHLQGEAPVAMGETENALRVSDFLLEIYHDASECTPDELRLRVLKNLQRFISFDFGVWGGGWANGRLVTDLTVLNQSEAILGEWDSVAREDGFCDLTLNRLGATARFDASSSISLLVLVPFCCRPVAHCAGTNLGERISLARASVRSRELGPSTIAGRLVPQAPFPLRDQSPRAGAGVQRTALRLPEGPWLPWQTPSFAGQPAQCAWPTDAHPRAGPCPPTEAPHRPLGGLRPSLPHPWRSQHQRGRVRLRR